MKKSQFTDTQLKHVQIFNLILECDGWVDYLSIESQLNEGRDVSPEGMMSTQNDYVQLEAQLHVPVQMISLSIADSYQKHKADIFFFYDDHPERVLEWMVANRMDLDLESFQDLLRKQPEVCKTILLAESNAESIELKPLTTG